MATFVLVPGAWLGVWCWQRVTPLLRAAGHDVYPLTLTGLGERSHLASPAVDLDTHIQDAVNVLDYEDLHDIVLVGHSYAGLVIGGVAERTPDRLARLVYLDALVPADGQSLYDIAEPAYRAAVEAEARAGGDGWRWPMPAERPGRAGLTDADERWLQSRAVAHPLGTFRQPVRLAKPAAAAIPRSYIVCTRAYEGEESSVPDLIRELCAAHGWRLRELPTGHWPMVSMPAELAAHLLAEAAVGPNEHGTAVADKAESAQ